MRRFASVAPARLAQPVRPGQAVALGHGERRDLAGDTIRPKNVAPRELLLMDMVWRQVNDEGEGEQVDDPGSGNWHRTDITYLR
jgi:hypothetical protein